MSSRLVRIKAFTCRQPGASLLALGEAGPKRFLQHCLPTKYRGPIAIHAGAVRHLNYAGKRDLEWLKAVAHGFSWKPEHDTYEGLLTFMSELPYGQVVGVGWLHDCKEIIDDTWKHISVAERILGDWTPGRYAYEFRHMLPLEKPIDARGRLGLWNWDAPEELVERLAA